MTGSGLLLVERPRPELAVVTLNRPNAMNALSMALRRELIDTFDGLATEGVAVVILTGAGRAFTAGLDLKEMSEDTSPLESIPSLSPIAAVRRYPGIVIGAINGVAITGGFELAIACDILIASEEARFADTHIKVGAMPGWELSQRLSRAIGLPRAKRLSLTGEFIPARLAEAWGLVGEVVAPDQLMPKAMAVAETLLAIPTEALVAHKRLIDDGYAVTFQEGLAIETSRAAAHNAAVRPEEVVANRRTLGDPDKRAQPAQG
jgi:enoyl-CoA hydratase